MKKLSARWVTRLLTVEQKQNRIFVRNRYDKIGKITSNYELLPHPLYSPDLALCNFFLLPNLKNDLAERGLCQTKR